MMVVEGWDGDFRTPGGRARQRGEGRGSAGDHTVDGHRVEERRMALHFRRQPRQNQTALPTESPIRGNSVTCNSRGVKEKRFAR